jgi:hypothetical protein
MVFSILPLSYYFVIQVAKIFHCVVKMVLYSTTARNICQCVLKLGHIYCDKYTCLVLENTIGLHPNNSLKIKV